MNRLSTIKNVYVCGDTHRHIDIDKLYRKNAQQLTKEDLVIVLGDFGWYWAHYRQSKHDIMKLLKKLPFQLGFLPGNHENFDILKRLKPSKKDDFMCIDKMDKNELWYFPRGNVYNIANKKIFMFGGGLSIDKGCRCEGISWWKDEIASSKIEHRAFDSLEAHNDKVDFILTHTGPTEICMNMMNLALKLGNMHRITKMEDSTCKFLDHIRYTVEYKEWHFGHLHTDDSIDNFRCHYNDDIHKLI